MIIIGVDFHPEFQQIAFVDAETGELQERRLNHPKEAESFYRELVSRSTQVRVGMEAKCVAMRGSGPRGLYWKPPPQTVWHRDLYDRFIELPPPATSTPTTPPSVCSTLSDRTALLGRIPIMWPSHVFKSGSTCYETTTGLLPRSVDGVETTGPPGPAGVKVMYRCTRSSRYFCRLGGKNDFRKGDRFLSPLAGLLLRLPYSSPTTFGGSIKASTRNPDCRDRRTRDWSTRLSGKP